MNLSAYDKVTTTTSQTKLYLSNKYPYIVTREVKYRKYYCFVTRYEPSFNDTILYLVLLDDKPSDRTVAKTRRDDYGRLKFNMSIVGNKYNFPVGNNPRIKLILETEADDGDIYKIEIESD